MQTFASWDVDYLKNDNCGNCKYGYSNTPAKQVTRMGDALRRWGAEGSGRPIFFSSMRIFATRHVRVTISHHRGRAFCTSSMLAQSMSISRVSAITTTTTCWKWGMENSRMRRSARTSQYGASLPRHCWQGIISPLRHLRQLQSSPHLVLLALTKMLWRCKVGCVATGPIVLVVCGKCGQNLSRMVRRRHCC